MVDRNMQYNRAERQIKAQQTLDYENIRKIHRKKPKDVVITICIIAVVFLMIFCWEAVRPPLSPK